MNTVHLLAAEAGATTKFVDLAVPGWAWIALVTTIVVLLFADLFLVHRTAHEISIREALIESSVWITVAIAFGFVVAFGFGWAAAGEYFGGYLIEKSLSIDNVFVWAVIFSYFGIPNKYQFRVLFWGVFGALVLRAIFIFAGVALIEGFDWILYVFGALLLLTAYRMFRHDDKEVDPEANPVLKVVRRMIPSTDELDGQKMFTVVDGKRLATPLFAVLILVEATDVIFAVDSVPAILALSNETFIIFSSNAFAILGLRALYFALAGMAGRFRYLDTGLAAILTFVGIKMLLLDVVHLPILLSVGIITVILTVAILSSLRAERRDAEAGISPPEHVPTTKAAGIIGTRKERGARKDSDESRPHG